MLLKYGADIENKNEDEETALHVAAKCGMNRWGIKYYIITQKNCNTLWKCPVLYVITRKHTLHIVCW